MKALFVTAVVGMPQRLNQIYPAEINQEISSVDVTIENNALGRCTCDITLGSCDAYCCCDLDCNKEIRQFWNDNSDNYCAKNHIGKGYKP